MSAKQSAIVSVFFVIAVFPGCSHDVHVINKPPDSPTKAKAWWLRYIDSCKADQLRAIAKESQALKH